MSSFRSRFSFHILIHNRLLMKRRREHGECETRPGGRGCLVLGTSVCEVRKERMASSVMKRRLEGLLSGKMIDWWVLAGLLGLLIALAGGWVGLQMQSVQTINVG